MLRAMYQQLGEDDALSGLVERFDSQHFMLRDFILIVMPLNF